MSAPIIWIFFPVFSAIGLLFLRRFKIFLVFTGTFLALSLSWLAWVYASEQTLSFGSQSLEITDTFLVLGRRFVIAPMDSPIIVIIYLSVAFWFGGAVAAKADPLFIPTGMGLAALLTAALSVEPFLYAAVIIELVVLGSVPILVHQGRTVSAGLLRFIIFQTIGMTLILFSGWILEGIETSPGAVDSWLQASILLSLGIALLLGVFPFHTWIPMLAEDTHPFIAAFIFYVLTLVVTMFGLGLLDRYPALRAAQQLASILQYSGLITCLIGGVWAAFQRHLGRIMGFAVMVEIGMSLLALGVALSGLEEQKLLNLVFLQLLPRGLSLGIWSLAVTVLMIHWNPELNPKDALLFKNIQGAGRALPMVTFVLISAQFSLAGLPLFAGFPLKLALLTVVAKQGLWLVIVPFLSSLGLLAGSLRTLSVMVMGVDNNLWRITENWSEIILLGIGCLILLFIGLVPQAVYPVFQQLIELFTSQMP